ncbi:methionyl-tRNA formyltransferase [Candidatus Saccharibacteria bacterium]|nr:methionyl-tRNA formyltransferase [Candidatus Saccharibacteria bacterium]
MGVKEVPIIFFGVDRFPALPLEKLLAGGYNVRAIFAAPDKDGRGGKKVAPVAKVLGEKYGVPVFQPVKGGEILPILESLGVEGALGVLVSYGKMIPQAVLDWFSPMPIVNIHPSLLPKYRGSSPVESAILNGDEKTGVSIIKLVAEMDAGDVLAVREIDVAADETSSSLYEKAAQVGWEMLEGLIAQIVDGSAKSAGQSHDQATFTGRLEKEAAELTSEKTADELERKVRAFDVSPKAFLMHEGKRFAVLAGVVSEKRQTALDIEGADGKFYSPTVITPEGKKTMAVDDYLRGAGRG